MPQNSPSNILIIGHSNIGDVCYDLFVIHPLKQAFPDAKISYLTSSRSDNIPRHWKGIDQVIVQNKKDDKKILGRLPFMWSLRKQHFDLVIVLKSTMMHNFLGIPTAWNLRKFLGGQKLSDKNKHVIDIYLDFLEFHGIPRQKAVFNIQFNQQTENFCQKFLNDNHIQSTDRLIGIAPTAAWSLKSWPIAQWNALSKILKEKYNYKIIAFGKKMDDVRFGQLVMKNISPDIISAMDKTSLIEALALIKKCDIFIGPDSSLLHLASCMGIKTIGVYGATSKDYIYPYFHRQQMVVSKANIPCMPCYPAGTKNCERVSQNFCGQCMEEIPVDEVLTMIERLR